MKTKSNFSLAEKCFSLTNFSNGKQTQKSLENSFSKITFQKTNTLFILIVVVVVICLGEISSFLRMGFLLFDNYPISTAIQP